MGSFFQDALGDWMISGGVMQLTARVVLYEDGMATHETKKIKFNARKSIQPLYPDEAQLQGFGDYGTNEFINFRWQAPCIFRNFAGPFGFLTFQKLATSDKTGFQSSNL